MIIGTLKHTMSLSAMQTEQQKQPQHQDVWNAQGDRLRRMLGHACEQPAAL
jgi:hypothetical protein